jgi:predicted nucleic acid-binding protein
LSGVTLLDDAFTTAAHSSQTVYDCIYVAFAAAADVPLITPDERLASALGSRYPVRWLEAAPIT